MSALAPTPEAPWLDAVRQSVQSLQFGSVQITVHNGAVVQIEKIEKIRIEAPKPSAQP